LATDPEAIKFFRTAGIPLSPIFGKNFADVMDVQLKSLSKAVRKAKIPLVD
jgi:hypothetical protein